jgi:deoxyribodipyrimidine photo-lyase
MRVNDNPIFHHLSESHHDFTHFLPVYVVPPHQVEVSGFLAEGKRSPYPEARSRLGRYWRCGQRRALFTIQCAYDFGESLRRLDSDLAIRVGSYEDVVGALIDDLKSQDGQVGAVWVTKDETPEEVADEDSLERLCSDRGVGFRTWNDEKYYVDE